jgi:hypothetical protein
VNKKEKENVRKVIRDQEKDDDNKKTKYKQPNS